MKLRVRSTPAWPYWTRLDPVFPRRYVGIVTFAVILLSFLAGGLVAILGGMGQ